MFILIFSVLGLQVGYNIYKFNTGTRIYNDKLLNEVDKKSIREVISIKNKYGNKIWPGFEKQIPLLIFNEKYEFIIGYPDKLKSWVQIKNDKIDSREYYRRKSNNSQAFAVNINEIWTGSMSSLNYLNKNILLNIKNSIPFPLNYIIPYQMVLKSNDYHVVSIIHEVFHAFQVNQAGQKFEASQDNYIIEEEYPYNNQKMNELFTREGKLLKKAVKEKNNNKKIKLVKDFLELRKKRRDNLSRRFIAFEQNYEWLEGLAKYTEIKSYKIANKNSSKLELNYKNNLPHWETDFNNLEELGEQDSEYRFYLSGLTQAQLLDQLNIKWKKRIMKKDIYFEDILEDFIL